MNSEKYEKDRKQCFEALVEFTNNHPKGFGPEDILDCLFPLAYSLGQKNAADSSGDTPSPKPGKNKPKLKVGDFVKIVNEGLIGKIIHVVSYPGFTYYYYLVGVDSCKDLIPCDEVQIVPYTGPIFKPGDIVRCKYFAKGIPRIVEKVMDCGSVYMKGDIMCFPPDMFEPYEERKGGSNE